MPKATTESSGAHPGGTWRLVNGPRPALSERVGRLVGLRVLRFPGSRGVLVVAGTMDRLHELLPQPRALTPTSRARIVVAYWRRPRKAWSGRIGPVDYLIRQRVALPRLGRGTATVRLRLSEPLPLREVLRGAVHALAPTLPLPAPVSANLTSQGGTTAYLPTQLGAAVVTDALPLSTDIRAHDIVLRHPGVTAADGPVDERPYAVAVPTGRHGAQTPGGESVVLVDARRINPRGRRGGSYRPEAGTVRLDLEPTGRPARRPRAESDRRPLGGPGLDATTLATLRQVSLVECPPLTDERPFDTAALLVQLAMTGAVLRVPALPPRVAELLAPELRAVLATAPPVDDPLALEARSVRQRRAAMRGHAAGFALPRVAADALPELNRPPSVSAILATRRPEMLAGAVRAMIDQTYPELEIILCLHGIDLPTEVATMLTGSGRPYEIVRVAGTTGFGAALGEATRRARGSLVTKFDDDDSYGTEHVWDLVLARHYSGATLVGKGTEFVFLETLGVTVRRPSGVPESNGEMVAGGTMLLAKGDLEAVGGWRPVPRSVDYGVIERLRRDGAVIYRTHPLGYIYHRRESGHTWDPGQQYFLDTAFARWPGIPTEAFANPVAEGTGPVPEPLGAPLEVAGPGQLGG
ncbi:glycosyltransferase involved in cell wall biosynthesis [Micromonospora pisi]|uniref:Glycosyltransferase involved in cell wall biosynthesis n=1 Tax=Micromonospora pisi TaxID=589240 RepID=A0A495JVR5_9ACTN|nr:glycosyltransferase [Micromonospora pisi]RKR92412.1 glycosyltransferase involved in cell wall biosynthesis [Micromonospora pisi]